MMQHSAGATVLVAVTGIAGASAVAVTAAVNFAADAATNPDQSFPITQLLTAGGSITVAGVLLWIVWMFKNGEIVGRDTARERERLAEEAAKTATREDRLAGLLTEATARERDYRQTFIERR